MSQVTIETLWPSLLPLLRLMNSNPRVAHAKRIPNGYGHLRVKSYSGWENWQAIQNWIQANQDTWKGISFDYPEITELFNRYQ